MVSTGDFVIENGVLKKYRGSGGKVFVPSGVMAVGADAFFRCERVTDIVLPGSVKSIGDSAFFGCEKLTGITIPNSVKSIGDGAFRGCNGLANAQGFVVVRDVLYDYTGSDGKAIVPAGVTAIGSGAFSGCENLKEIIIPKGVTAIGKWVFSKCKNLTGVAMPDGVTSIGYKAFSGCESLTELAIPESVTSIGAEAFSECPKLKRVALPSALKELGGPMFHGCESLESVRIPDGVTELGRDFFGQCKKLKRVSLPEGLKTIGERAFAGCRSLESLYIPESVTRIGLQAFASCKKLKELSLPLSLPAMGNAAFMGCPALADEYGCVICDHELYSYCGGEEANIPEGVTAIREEAFWSNKTVRRVHIPSSVKTIGRRAFRKCASLESVTIEEGVETIGDEVFSNCPALAQIELPDSVTALGEGAFASCRSLPRGFAAEMKRKVAGEAPLPKTQTGKAKAAAVPKSVRPQTAAGNRIRAAAGGKVTAYTYNDEIQFLLPEGIEFEKQTNEYGQTMGATIRVWLGEKAEDNYIPWKITEAQVRAGSPNNNLDILEVIAQSFEKSMNSAGDASAGQNFLTNRTVRDFRRLRIHKPVETLLMQGRAVTISILGLMEMEQCMMLCRISERSVLTFLCSRSGETDTLHEAWYELIKSVRVNGKAIELGGLTSAKLREKLG